MDLLAVVLLAVGLAMDAFAVSICKGLAMRKLKMSKAVIIGLWFGGFQALMPFIGYILGSKFEKFINAVAPYVGFFLLVLIGGNMIKEALHSEDEVETDSTDFKEMLVLAIATSIDALAVGITFACVPISITSSISRFANTMIGIGIIGVITFIISIIGVKIGNIFGSKYKNKAEFAGGVILILIAIKIIIQ